MKFKYSFTQSQESHRLDLRPGPGASIPTFVRSGENKDNESFFIIKHTGDMFYYATTQIRKETTNKIDCYLYTLALFFGL